MTMVVETALAVGTTDTEFEKTAVAMRRAAINEASKRRRLERGLRLDLDGANTEMSFQSFDTRARPLRALVAAGRFD